MTQTSDEKLREKCVEFCIEMRLYCSNDIEKIEAFARALIEETERETLFYAASKLDEEPEGHVAHYWIRLMAQKLRSLASKGRG
jgi:hypothetical protein